MTRRIRANKLTRRQYTGADIGFQIVNTFMMLLVIFITVYPFVYVFMASISNPVLLRSHRGLLLWSLGYTPEGYKSVLHSSEIGIGYINTMFYVIVGTFMNLSVTMMLAYVMAQKNYLFKNALAWMIIITMFFNGGLIPTFMVVKRLKLYDNVFSVILVSLVSTWNLIIMKTSFSQLPDGLLESARIDGANDITILLRIVIPISKPIIAVISLYYAVFHWNSWFNEMIYLRNAAYKPLQLVLREILILSDLGSMSEGLESVAAGKVMISENIKYATIIVSTLPILFVYPFIQKYFVKGVMIGAIKG